MQAHTSPAQLRPLPSHLFASDVDGALYDTRVANWAKARPLRPIYQRGFPEIRTTAEFKAALQEILPDGVCGEPAGKLKDACRMRLRQAVDLIGCVENSGSWFTEVDGRDNYRTGEHETRSLHPPDTITGASYGRLIRLLQAS